MAWPGNPDSCLQAVCEINRNGVVSMLLIDPHGDMAAWTFPEGPGNFGRTAVQHPMAGTWTGIISSPIGTSDLATSGTTGTVKWQVAAQKDMPFGNISPSQVTLAPGQQATVTVSASSPAAPGDRAWPAR